MKEWFQAAAKFGVPSVLLTVLLYWLLGDFNVRLRAIEAQHGTMLQYAEQTKSFISESKVGNERVLSVLVQMCVNDAKNQEARRLCLEVGR